MGFRSARVMSRNTVGKELSEHSSKGRGGEGAGGARRSQTETGGYRSQEEQEEAGAGRRLHEEP